MKTIITLFIMSLCVSFSFAQTKPKLVLQITVDQLRGDMPFSIQDRWTEGGFKYLLDSGVWYANAHHPHANTETIVGHITLSTGAYPSSHGMISNAWFDYEEDRLVYNIEDNAYDATGGKSSRDQASEVDHSQVSKSEGRSPHNILTTTFSDEMASAYGPQSKIFAVSGKDRGAVSMAGHNGKAFWYSTKDGAFTSSTFYYDEFPKWVSKWNGNKKADQYKNDFWKLMNDIKTYRFGEEDDRPFENPEDIGYGKVFPHPYGDSKYYYTLLMASPVVDELTVDFAKQLIVEENIGQDDVTDYLSISLSSTDYIGHLFGPNSLESEDNLIRLDQNLANLFQFIDQKVGLENTLIVLSSDHGAPESAQSLKAKGFPVDVLDISQLDLTEIDLKLKKQFGIGKEVIKLNYVPYVYLDRKLIKEKGLDLGEVSKVIAEELTRIDGIAYAYTSTDVAMGNLADTPITRRVLNNYHPKRSGDIYIINEPNWSFTVNGDIALVNHGSPWSYDTSVPVVFVGNHLEKKMVYSEISTIDIAITLSKYLKILEPSGAEGQPLEEVLNTQ
ncbi:alkaline phosphatase family protein [Flammeovirga sp. EKP202]|uniref:alkaline phosphatase family protein n=1 Tax=Flammeovirga sp. EKP202 TaxID=2770592 RepID=UPI00165F8757|nr:alkaline phosphatase family protein [Flammeovirga sp. EKP202]MBD0404759.1 alkaline phosphatase family protein [Flammeovirga sp. EKP202]